MALQDGWEKSQSNRRLTQCSLSSEVNSVRRGLDLCQTSCRLVIELFGRLKSPERWSPQKVNMNPAAGAREDER